MKNKKALGAVIVAALIAALTVFLQWFDPPADPVEPDAPATTESEPADETEPEPEPADESTP
jgi:hypothetical protein